MSKGKKPYPKESGPIPNVINDDWSKCLKGNEFKIVFLIARKTFGFRKEWDKIAISQMAEYTGLSERTCQRIRTALVNRGVLLCKSTRGGSSMECCEYSLNMGWQSDTRDNLTPVTNRASRGDKMTPQGVTATTPTKFTIQNSQIQNTHPASADDIAKYLAEPFRLYNQHIRPADMVQLDYQIRKAIACTSIEIVRDAILQVVSERLADPNREKRYMPHMSNLLGDTDKLRGRAADYQPPAPKLPEWMRDGDEERIISTVARIIKNRGEVPKEAEPWIPQAQQRLNARLAV